MFATFSKPTLINICENMKDPEQVRSFMLNPQNRNQNPIGGNDVPWEDLCLAGGYPSLVLLFSALEQKELFTEDISHKYILKIKESVEQSGLPSSNSLFSGIAGLCHSIQFASRSGERYKKILEVLNSFLLEKIQSDCVSPILKVQNNRIPLFISQYDVIQGICGIGRYALENLENPRFYLLVKDFLHILIRISQPTIIDGVEIPGWYVSKEDPFYQMNQYKGNGAFNLGLAHGVTGILAFLSISLNKGVEIEGQKEAITRISLWIKARAFLRNNTICWPSWVSYEEEVGIIPFKEQFPRDAWCYGVPGIARPRATDADSLRINRSDLGWAAD